MYEYQNTNEPPKKTTHYFWRQLDCNFLIKKTQHNTKQHWSTLTTLNNTDQMDLMEMRKWKTQILIISMKTDFCSLISQMLALRHIHLASYKQINSYKQIFQ